MNPKAYFKDLSAQLRAVQNRVRQLIGNAHWPSDGAWKESALRAVIRGYLPASLSVGTGFILSTDGPSTQIDILVYDDTAPILFRDGDFVVLTPDSVRAVIEVKTSLSRPQLVSAVDKLSKISHLLRKRCLQKRPFIGLFSYEESDCAPADVLLALQRVNGCMSDYEIAALCFGDEQFFRYWEYDPRSTARRRPYESWHAYQIPQSAPGYFIHNVIEHLFPQSVDRAESLWYPIDGKENRRVAVQRRRVNDVYRSAGMP
ncbi:MAG: hypothetical protein KBC32_11115 [Candidatus Didemnitutus sp.]|nr:hypothetical protein [Candidatus Didemnitutus sp.]